MTHKNDSYFQVAGDQELERADYDLLDDALDDPIEDDPIEDDAPLNVELAVSILTETMSTSADIQDQLERDDTGQSCDLSASGFRILIVDYHFEDRIYFHQPPNVHDR